jgi:hypothetical protein
MFRGKTHKINVYIKIVHRYRPKQNPVETIINQIEPKPVKIHTNVYTERKGKNNKP